MLPARPWILAISLSSAVLGLAPVAQAAEAPPRGDVEIAAGAATPLGGSDYADRFSSVVGLGLRGVMWLGGGASWRAGLELAGQGARAPYEIDLGEFGGIVGFDTYRLRGLLGVRTEVPLSPRFALTFRVLGGVEHMRTEELHFAGPAAPRSDRLTDTAPAAELGAGAQLVFGSLRFGAELALPVAFYGIDVSQERFDVGGGGTIDVQTDLVAETTVDLELRLSAGVRF